MLKGSTGDFVPARKLFHVTVESAPPGSKPIPVHFKDLKAVFFVKDFAGNPSYQDYQELDPNRPVLGRKMKVVFNDGEVVVGTTQGYLPGRQEFFIIPADPNSNNERCFVVIEATAAITPVETSSKIPGRMTPVGSK